MEEQKECMNMEFWKYYIFLKIPSRTSKDQWYCNIVLIKSRCVVVVQFTTKIKLYITLILEIPYHEMEQWNKILLYRVKLWHSLSGAPFWCNIRPSSVLIVWYVRHFFLFWREYTQHSIQSFSDLHISIILQSIKMTLSGNGAPIFK